MNVKIDLLWPIESCCSILDILVVEKLVRSHVEQDSHSQISEISVTTKMMRMIPNDFQVKGVSFA